MTETEERYAQAYREKKNSVKGRELSSDEWNELGEIRKSLGLSYGQGARITKEVDSSFEEIKLDDHPLRAYRDLSLSNMSQEMVAQYGSLLKEIDDFEDFINKIINDTAQLQEQVDHIVGTISKFGNAFAKTATKSFNKGDMRTAKAATGITALIGLGSWLYQKYEEHELSVRQEKQMAEILQKKKQMAQTKLPYIQERRKSLSMLVSRFDKPLDIEFDKTVEIGKYKESKELKSFKLAFCMKAKMHYIDALFEYVENEMTAWLNGRQSCGDLKPMLAETVDYEVYSWFVDEHIDRSTLAKVWEENNSTEVKVPYLFILSEPYLLRRHVGILLSEYTGYEADAVFASDYYGEPLIKDPLNNVYASEYGEDRPVSDASNNLVADIKKSRYYFACLMSIRSSHSEHPKAKVKTWVYLLIILCGLFIMALGHIIFGIIAVLLGIYREKAKLNKLKEDPSYYENHKIEASKLIADRLYSYIDCYEPLYTL